MRHFCRMSAFNIIIQKKQKHFQPICQVIDKITSNWHIFAIKYIMKIRRWVWPEDAENYQHKLPACVLSHQLQQLVYPFSVAQTTDMFFQLLIMIITDCILRNVIFHSGSLYDTTSFVSTSTHDTALHTQNRIRNRTLAWKEDMCWKSQRNITAYFTLYQTCLQHS